MFMTTFHVAWHPLQRPPLTGQPIQRIFWRGQSTLLWVPLSATLSLSVAIFTGRRGVGNAVCRNFLFPLGWPACGLNSTLTGPPTLPAGWVAQLRRRRGAKRQTTDGEGESGGKTGVADRPTSLAGGKWCTQRGLGFHCARSNDARQRPQ